MPPVAGPDGEGRKVTYATLRESLAASKPLGMTLGAIAGAVQVGVMADAGLPLVQRAAGLCYRLPIAVGGMSGAVAGALLVIGVPLLTVVTTLWMVAALLGVAIGQALFG